MFLALTAYLVAAWIISGDAKPTPVGPTPVPTWMRIVVHSGEALSVIFALVFVYLFLIKPWRREGQLTTDGMFCIGFFLLFWQDSIINYVQPMATYNSIMLNFGSWDLHIPGWLFPNGNLMAEPVLFTLPVYIWGVCGWVFLICWIMRKTRERWPSISNLGLVGVAFTVAVFTDILIEPAFMKMGFWAYPGTIRSLTMFAGKYYQFPIYEAVLWGALLTLWAALRFFKNDKGQMIMERGVDKLHARQRTKNVLRLLAIIGVLNLTELVGYNVPYQIINAHQDPWPQDIIKRSYLMDGFCGPGTTYACFGPKIPIARNSSARVGPDGELVPAGTPRLSPGSQLKEP